MWSCCWFVVFESQRIGVAAVVLLLFLFYLLKLLGIKEESVIDILLVTFSFIHNIISRELDRRCEP